MRKAFNLTVRWGPALVIMSVIFLLSSQTRSRLPNFGPLDYIVKKSGHMLGYGLLASAYWWGLGRGRRQSWYAWILAVIYAGTDEFHQSFVAGRDPSVVDVLVFDNLGAATALVVTGPIWRRLISRKLTQTPGRSPRLPPKPRDDLS